MSGRNSHDGDIRTNELCLRIDNFGLTEYRFLQLRKTRSLLSRCSMECKRHRGQWTKMQIDIDLVATPDGNRCCSFCPDRISIKRCRVSHVESGVNRANQFDRI